MGLPLHHNVSTAPPVTHPRMARTVRRTTMRHFVGDVGLGVIREEATEHKHSFCIRSFFPLSVQSQTTGLWPRDRHTTHANSIADGFPPSLLSPTQNVSWQKSNADAVGVVCAQTRRAKGGAQQGDLRKGDRASGWGWESLGDERVLDALFDLGINRRGGSRWSRGKAGGGTMVWESDGCGGNDD